MCAAFYAHLLPLLVPLHRARDLLVVLESEPLVDAEEGKAPEEHLGVVVRVAGGVVLAEDVLERVVDLLALLLVADAVVLRELFHRQSL